MMNTINSLKNFSGLRPFFSFFIGLLLLVLGVGDVVGQFNVNAVSTNYTQNFNGLTNGTWSNNTTLTGWYARTSATASITSYAANTGSTTTQGLYAFGVAGTNALTDRALGFATTNGFTGAAGTGKNFLGWRLKNNTGSAISSITITWSGEQWRRDNANSQTLEMSYQISSSGGTVTDLTSGTWISASSIFSSPQLSATALVLDGNTPANRTTGISVTLLISLPVGDEIMLRWEDLNNTGNDHHLAIDDVIINATGAPTAADAVDFCNLQAPASGTIVQGGVFNVYAKAYEPGVTEAPGAGAGIDAWIGYSSSNTDPSGTGWTWIPASFNAQTLNDDEFLANIGPSLTPGTYFYASRFQLNGGPMRYGGFNGGFWNGTSNVSGVLTVESPVVDYGNLQFPLSGTILLGGNYDVYAQVYEAGVTEAGGAGAGISTWIGYNTTNNNPNSVGWTWIPATFFGQVGNNDEFILNLGTQISTPGVYYYASRFQLNGGDFRYGGYNGGFWNGTSNVNGTLTIQAPEINVLGNGNTIADGAATPSLTNHTDFGTVNVPSGTQVRTFTIQNTGTATLTVGAITIGGAAAGDFSVTSTPSASVAAGSTTTFDITFDPTANGLRAATISFATNDADENPYNFSIQGNGLDVPVITSSLTASGVQGNAFSYTITATNTPTTYAATPLPAGLSINASTGAITGTPTATGTTNVSITATNAAGSDVETLVITISAGACFSANAPTFSTSGSTSVGDTDAGGSPTNTIRLASGGSGGTISTTATGVNAGNVTLKFRAKGWSGIETNVTVTLDGQVVNITTLPTTFQEITLNFTSVSANPVLQFSTVINKRVHIGNVSIFCPPAIPTLTATPTTLSNLDYTVGFGPSAVQTFDLTGTNLDGSNVNLVLGNNDFEISSDNVSFSDALTLPAFSGASQPIYVRLKSGLAVNAYTDVIAIAGGGVAVADEPTVNLSGTVTAVVTPVITSSLAESVVYGSSVSYQITANNTPTSFGAITLPTGLSINASGLISGTITASVGTVNTTISATNAAGTDSETLVWTITPKSVTLSGLSGTNKVYDGTTSATLSGTGTLIGIVGADAVTLSGTPTGTFANKNVGTNKTITVSGYTLSGAQAGNYTLTQPTGLTANITQKSVTVTGATAQDKVYNGTTAASITGATLVGIISPDVVTVSGGGTFATANAGTGIAVTAALSLGGADAGNYALTQPTGLSANITKATPIFTTSPIAITVGGTYSLPGANISSTSNEVLSYTITAGGNATLAGTTITGAVVGTETLTVNQAEGTNYIAGSTTVAVNVTDIANGTYRTISAGTWPSGTATWERFNSGTWTTSTPGANTTDLLIVRHAITSAGSFAALGGVGTKMSVEENGVFNGNHACTFSELTIKSAGIFSVNTPSVTILASTGILKVENNGKLILNSVTLDNGDGLWNGIENFMPGSSVELQNWDWNNSSGGAYCLIASTPQISLNSSGFFFGNLLINATPSENFRLIHNSFSPGAGVMLKFVENDLIINNGSSSSAVQLGIASAHNVEIGGNVIVNSGLFRFASVSSTTVNHLIHGDLIQNGGEVQFNPTSGGASFVNLEGNFDIKSGASFNATVTGSKLVFSGNSEQTASLAGSLGAQVDFEIANGAYVKLINQNFNLSNSMNDFFVLDGGTLDFNFFNLVGIGTFTLNDGGTLVLTSSDSQGAITAAGINFGNVRTTTRTYHPTGGSYVFKGVLDQYYINTNSGLVPAKGKNLVIDNGTNSVFVGNDFTASNLLDMKGGNVFVETDKILELGENTTNKGTLAYTSGYVVGKMRRWFAGTNSGTSMGLFPMGVNESGLKNRFSLIEYSTAPGLGGHLTVEFISSPMLSASEVQSFLIPAVNSGGFGYNVTSVEDQGYWKIDNQAGTLTDGEYSISCTGEGFETITDLAQVTLLKRVGAGAWFCPGNHQTSSGSAAVPTVRRSGVVGYSNFGFGAPISVNPLPVELTKFEASCSSDGILVSWETASEKNASHFDLETSIDGENWSRITSASAVGNSSQIQQYAFNDVVRASIQYYRLSQVDLNGATEMYHPIAVQCEMNTNVLVYPNPVQGQLQLLNLGNNGATISISTTDGRTVYTSSTDQNFVQIPTENFESGTYFVHIRLADGTTVLEKIIKQ